ncbi:hypothetical protein AWI35_12060 [Klebsiella aerogenes]|nr:hypothetical protein AWI09_08305 [Klebsiella aerogenes]KUR15510.1 hypothetical protein AWI35_12060 [Klebsiella aerogenes]
MTHRFDIVSIWRNDKGGVVIGVVIRPQSRRAVILASGGQRRVPEGINLLAAVGAKGDMQRRGASRGERCLFMPLSKRR